MEKVEEIDMVRQKALQIVKVHSSLAAIAALSPVPITDVAGIGGVQLAMLIRLSKLFKLDVDLTHYKDMIVGSLGGLVTEKILEWAASAVKTIPVIGTALGTLIQVPIAFAVTYAIGRVWIYL